MRRLAGMASSEAVTGTLTYWAMACTPASVRPAHVRWTSRRSSVSRERVTSPATVRRPGCAANPQKSAPR